MTLSDVSCIDRVVTVPTAWRFEMTVRVFFSESSQCWMGSTEAGYAPLPLNYYGQPVVPPEVFMGEHIANPGSAGMPPVCSCNWTRHEVNGRWVEMSEHLADMRSSAAVREP